MSVKSSKDLAGLRAAGRAVGTILRELSERVQPGVTTGELDREAARLLALHAARPAPAIEYGFPGSICISVNDEAIHGVPGMRMIREGDLVKLDLTAEKDGYIADAAISVAVEPVSIEAQRVIRCAENAFRQALRVAHAGYRVYEIGRVVEREVRRSGCSVLRELSGHGTGRKIHEEPSIPNYHEPRARTRLTNGLVITIEPIVSAGSGQCYPAEDGWTVRTTDRSLAAHHEHTMVITSGEPILLTVAA
jgi:methionyl aminopeptidase